MQGGKRGIRQDSERALHHVRPGMQCLPLPYAHPRLSGSGVFFRLAIGGDAIPSVIWIPHKQWHDFREARNALTRPEAALRRRDRKAAKGCGF